MKVNIKKILVFVLVYIFLFQDTILFYFNNGLINNLDELFVLLYAVIALVYCIRAGRINKSSTIIFMLAFVYLFIGAVSGLSNSNYQIYNLTMGGLLMVKVYILIFATSNVPLEETILKNIIKALKSAAFICAIIGILNITLPSVYLSIFPFGFLDLRMGLTSVMSLFIHPGQFGWFMLFISILYFSEFLGKGNRKSIFFLIFYAIMALLSFKVKVIIGILLVFIIYVFVIERKKIKLSYIIAVLALITAIWVFFRDLILNNFSIYFTQGDTLSARYALTSTSLEIIKDYFPIGVGFGKFASWFARVDYSEFYFKYGLDRVYGLNPQEPFFATDTFWPAVFGETGFLGTITYIALLIFIFLKLLKKSRVKNEYLYLFSVLIFVQALVESMGEQIFNSSPQFIMIGLFVGMTLSNRRRSNEKNSILHA